MESKSRKYSLYTAVKWVVVLSSSALLISCSNGDDSRTSDSPSTNPGLDTGTSPLYVTVGAYSEGTKVGGIVDTCYFDATAAPGGATKTCVIRIPELQLHYSDLEFTVGTGSTESCEQILFRPYYFVRSMSATYAANGVDDIDCSALADINCFGGAAPNMIEDFPAVGGIYFLPSQMLSNSYTLQSSNTRAKGPDEVDLSFTSTNVNAANNLATAQRAASLSTGSGDDVNYLGSSMQDYEFSCRDKWANSLYSMKIIIADEDTTSESHDDGLDTFFDWFD